MSSVFVPGTGTTTFAYDPFGRRIQKTSALGTTVYLYDGLGPSLAEEVDNSGNVLARYTEGPAIDQPLAEYPTSTASYYEQDGLGSVSSLSNSGASVAASYSYDSYGKQVASTGTLINPFQYTGREYDNETGLYFLRARYYDPNVGRFISEDPIGFGGGGDFYKYVFNSPVNMTDPRGLAPYCVMTSGGLQCTNNNPVDFPVGVLQSLFPGSSPQGASLVIHMRCDDVSRLLMNYGYYTGSFFSVGNWLSQNPFLFWDPIAHHGGSEWRDRFGFHFRMKYGKSCDKDCTLDQFHIDDHNPMYDPWGHFIHDIPQALGF